MAKSTLGSQTPSYPSPIRSSPAPKPPQKGGGTEHDPDAGMPAANVDENDAWGHSAPLPKR